MLGISPWRCSSATNARLVDIVRRRRRRKRAPTATTRGADDDSIARAHAGGVLCAEVDASCGIKLAGGGIRHVPDPEVHAAGGVMAAVEAPRVIDAPLREDGDLYGDAEFNLSDDAVAAGMQTCSARAGSQGEVPEDDGVATLEDLGVGDACVGHVDVNPRCAMPVGSLDISPILEGHQGDSQNGGLSRDLSYRSTSTGNGLIVPESLGILLSGKITAKAKCKIIAITLRCRTGFKRSQDDICDSLAL